MHETLVAHDLNYTGYDMIHPNEESSAKFVSMN